MQTWVQRLAIAAIILFAIYTRLEALSLPNYWYDEAITALRVAGHTEQEVWVYAESRSAFPIGDLKQFVEVTPKTSLSDTVHSLAVEDSQHTPAYYIVARWWAMAFGSSVEAGRALAGLFSLFAIAAMYFLCHELFVMSGAFTSTAVCWAGVLVMTISPYQVAIAREHREYSMWALTSIAVCWALLRAVRKQTVASWIVYAFVASISIYTHLLTICMMAFLGACLLIWERFRVSAKVLSFVAASIAAGLSCIPWFLVLLSRSATAQSSLGWSRDFSRGRFQLGVALDPAFQVANYSIWQGTMLLSDLIGYSVTRGLILLTPLLFLCGLWLFGKDRRVNCSIFIVAMIASVSGLLASADFLTGSTSGWAYRYAVPSSIGWVLAITMFLTIVVTESGPLTSLGRVLALTIVSAGAISAVTTHNSQHTMLKAWEPRDAIIQFLNANGKSTLISDDFVGSLITLGHSIPDQLALLWHPRCYSCPRVNIPTLDIPFSSSNGAKAIYYRSWINTPPTGLQRLVDGMGEDRLDDPRFHTAGIRLDSPQINLFLFTSR